MKKTKIKELLKTKSKQNAEELDSKIASVLAVYCIENELHMMTIYKLCKTKQIDQMLDTMYDTTVKEYKLHTPTIERLRNNNTLREEIVQRLKEINLKLPNIW